ncbi:GerAB/ArcD/ProY family transporter [Paenibacillus ferrarius]|uniref:GerAB/ArcD/ProY family transporter n=1 Tax=Paenibacillus ferrarius TaxID=1469647 RepID=UPI003D29BB6B
MMRNVKISVNQFAVIVMIFTIGTTILVIPSGLAAAAKQDAWIGALLGVCLNVGIVCLYNKVGSCFPNMTLIAYNEQLFGKWLGKLFALGFIFFSFVGATTVLFYMGNFITTQVMPDTPIQAINVLFALVVVMGVRLGLETIARAAEIFFPWIIILFIVLVACLLPEIEAEKLQPVFSSGGGGLVRAALELRSAR